MKLISTSCLFNKEMRENVKEHNHSLVNQLMQGCAVTSQFKVTVVLQMLTSLHEKSQFWMMEEMTAVNL